MDYNSSMLEVRETLGFSRWLETLSDAQARILVQARILRLRQGNPGDVKPVGEGVSEARIDFGPGYRVYWVLRNKRVIFLLAGGTKKTQDKDIKSALKLARTV